MLPYLSLSTQCGQNGFACVSAQAQTLSTALSCLSLLFNPNVCVHRTQVGGTTTLHRSVPATVLSAHTHKSQHSHSDAQVHGMDPYQYRPMLRNAAIVHVFAERLGELVSSHVRRGGVDQADGPPSHLLTDESDSEGRCASSVDGVQGSWLGPWPLDCHSEW